LLQGHIVPPDGGVEIHRLVDFQATHQFLDRHGRRAQSLQLAFEDVAPFGNMLRMILCIEECTYLAPRPTAGEIAERAIKPVAAGSRFTRSQHFNPFTVLQYIAQGHDPSIDLRATASVPDLGMNVVREIQRGRAAHQVDDFTLRREDVHPVGIELLRKALDELIIVTVVQQLAERVDALLQIDVDRAAFLVGPVRGNAVFRMFVHGARANLDLDGLAARADDSRMQRAVAVALRVGDVVVEFVHDRLPDAVHDTEYAIALLHILDEHTNRAYVEQIVKLKLLGPHLLVDAVDVLRPAEDVRIIESSFTDTPFECRHEIADISFPGSAVLLERLGDPLVGGRLDDAESHILELPLELPEAKPIGKWRIDGECLASDVDPIGLIALGQSVQALGSIGEFDQHDANVLHHGEHHASQGLGLLAGSVGRTLDTDKGCILHGQLIEPAEQGGNDDRRVGTHALQLQTDGQCIRIAGGHFAYRPGQLDGMPQADHLIARTAFGQHGMHRIDRCEQWLVEAEGVSHATLLRPCQTPCRSATIGGVCNTLRVAR